MYWAQSDEGQTFEGNTMKELARDMYNHRATQVQVINAKGDAVGDFSAQGIAMLNDMIRNEESNKQQEAEGYNPAEGATFRRTK